MFDVSYSLSYQVRNSNVILLQRCSRKYGGEMRWKMHKKFRLEILKGRGHLEDLGIDGRIILQKR